MNRNILVYTSVGQGNNKTITTDAATWGELQPVLSEYGITVRWKKNYLKIIRLLLERRKNFRMYGSIRLCSNFTLEQAKNIGISHISLCFGAGSPNILNIPNILVKGVRTASDFLMKPWKNEKIVETITTILSNKKSSHSKKEHLNSNSEDIIGDSDVMTDVFVKLKKVAPTDANVLILGENGTGKFVFAKEIHLQSNRKNHPFIHVDLGSLNENLFESELFGYVKGAFTDAHKDSLGRFELAKGGTIFLDEIGNLPLHLQSKLLTVIQNRKVTRLGEGKETAIDARIICATNAPIHQMVDEQTFRQDLLFRINTIELNLPPLRERTDDINLLEPHFLEKLAQKYRKKIENFSQLIETKGLQ